MPLIAARFCYKRDLRTRRAAKTCVGICRLYAKFLQCFRRLQPDAIRLILSASTEFETVMRALNEAEIFRYLPKPWQPGELRTVIGQALARRDEADRISVQTGQATAQELAERRLEADEPGITKVNWGPDGSVMLD